MRAAATDTRLGIQSVEVAGSVLAAFARAELPAKLSELSALAGLPAAKVHRYLVSLARIGLVAQEPGGSRYTLGPMALELGTKAQSSVDAFTLAGGAMEALQRETGLTVALAVWGSQGPTLVRVAEPRHEPGISVPPGHVCPVTTSATGRVFAAFRQEADVRRMIGTSRTFATQLTRVRRDGLSAVAGGEGRAIAAISAPVFDHSGALVFALTVFGSRGHVNVDEKGPVARLLLAESKRLSAQLGFRAET